MKMQTVSRIGVLLAAAALSSTAAAAAPAAGFIAAAGRADLAYDVAGGILYISGGSSLRRYDMTSQSFLAPITLGGSTLGMDISPDGSTLAVANRGFGSTQNYVDLVNLKTGSSSRVHFDLGFGEGGTFTVAYDRQSQLLVSSQYLGSGWTQLRRYDGVAHTTTLLGEVRQDTMLAASADRSVVGVAESNISDGRWGYYHPGDTDYSSQHQWYDPVTGGTGWFNFEIGVSRDGSQFAIPTYGGTFIGDAVSVTPRIGEYAGETPIGVAYSTVSDRVFLPFAGTNYIGEYDTATLTEVNRYRVPGQFDWVGNHAFQEGRTKVAADGSYFFSTLDDGVYFRAMVPEPSTWAFMVLGGLLIGAGLHARRATQWPRSVE